MKIFIIPCGSKKADKACQAQQMYLGGYFQANLSFARKHSNHIFILSAKYGFLRLDQIIQPYELHMKNSTLSNEILRRQAATLGIINEIPFVLGGENYINKCSQIFKQIQRVIPKGLGMGEQIAFLKRNM